MKEKEIKRRHKIREQLPFETPIIIFEYKEPIFSDNKHIGNFVIKETQMTHIPNIIKNLSKK